MYLHSWELVVLSNSKMPVLNNSIVIVLIVFFLCLLQILFNIAHTFTLIIVVHVATSITFTPLVALSFGLIVNN